MCKLLNIYERESSLVVMFEEKLCSAMMAFGILLARFPPCSLFKPSILLFVVHPQFNNAFTRSLSPIIISIRYVAANLAICEPFLDPNLVAALKKRVGLVGTAGVAAAAQLKAEGGDNKEATAGDGGGAAAMNTDATSEASGAAAGATEEDGTLAAVAAAVAAKQTAMAPRGASGSGVKLSSAQVLKYDGVV